MGTKLVLIGLTTVIVLNRVSPTLSLAGVTVMVVGSILLILDR